MRYVPDERMRRVFRFLDGPRVTALDAGQVLVALAPDLDRLARIRDLSRREVPLHRLRAPERCAGLRRQPT